MSNQQRGGRGRGRGSFGDKASSSNRRGYGNPNAGRQFVYTPSTSSSTSPHIHSAPSTSVSNSLLPSAGPTKAGSKDYTYREECSAASLLHLDLSQFTLFTCGYGGRSITEFLESLTSNRIDYLIDVRIRPASAMKEFNSDPLRKALEGVGIQYTHMLELGNIFKDTANTDPELMGPNPYVELLSSGGESLTRRLREMISSNSERRIAIMCACGELRYCHRNAVSGYMQARHKIKLIHI